MKVISQCIDMEHIPCTSTFCNKQSGKAERTMIHVASHARLPLLCSKYTIKTQKLPSSWVQLELYNLFCRQTV